MKKSPPAEEVLQVEDELKILNTRINFNSSSFRLFQFENFNFILIIPGIKTDSRV